MQSIELIVVTNEKASGDRSFIVQFGIQSNDK